MSEPFRLDAPDIAGRFQPLPGWLADRLLQDDERVTWVRGPRFNPSWERYVTHPALFLLALVFAAFCLAASRLIAGEWAEATWITGLTAGGVVLAAVFVLGFFSGYFTRLVVTDLRLVIVQGYEVVRSWGIDELPRSLVRYGPPRAGGRDRAVDLDAVKALLGGGSDKFSESGKILAFGKKVASIKSSEERRP